MLTVIQNLLLCRFKAVTDRGSGKISASWEANVISVILAEIAKLAAAFFCFPTSVRCDIQTSTLLAFEAMKSNATSELNWQMDMPDFQGARPHAARIADICTNLRGGFS
ncbi:hypothetical protein [Pseudovibrio axinellae]|uniref:hypothetical protein n=1 Tax=Pseudovibrio axinellae TaxID=989403 RepID=UPI00083240EA|nr:hypothetical protein [Pseudovibrio axinellae]